MSEGAAPPVVERRFSGVGVSPGIARGTIFVHRPEDDEPPVRRIEEAEIPREITRFEAALLATRMQISEMQERIATSIGAKDASIFDAHLLVVEDRTLIDEVLRNLRREKYNIEHTFAQDRKSTRLNSSHPRLSRMPSSA